MQAMAVSKEDGRILLDNLPWDTIALEHGSRDMDQCRGKWHRQLSPSMVSRGVPSVSWRPHVYAHRS